MHADDISVVIPTIRPRRHKLAYALGSVARQDLLPVDVIVQDDITGVGAPANRQAGLERVRTPWVAFLDDDDIFYPQHLARLLATAHEFGAAYVWSYFDLVSPGVGPHNEDDPLGHFGKQWDDDAPIQTTITTLVRTDLAQSVGFVTRKTDDAMIAGQRVGEDYQFTLGCRATGAVFRHLPERTWCWVHWSANLSGRPWRHPDVMPLALAGING